MTSLRRRVSLGLISSFALIMIIVWFFTTTTMQTITRDYVTSRLRHDSEALLVNLLAGKELSTNIPPIYRTVFSGHYYVVQDEDAIFRSRSLWDETLTSAEVLPGEFNIGEVSGPSNQVLLAFTEGFEKDGRRMTITVAEDWSPIVNELKAFNQRFAAMCLGVFFLLSVLQKLLVSSMLAPLENVRASLREYREGKSDRIYAPVPVEIESLVSEINTLADTARKRVERGRKALGNLGHALKHPLALMEQIVGATGASELEGKLRNPLADMRTIVDNELRRARIAGHVTAGQRFDPQNDLQDLINTIRMVYRDKSLTISLHNTATEPLALERQDMLECFGNLVDNACKWADSQVIVSLTADDGIKVTVEDDGKGMPESGRQAVLQRGKRLDETVHGHGLGLDIAQAIIEQYNGSIQLSDSESLGGLKVTVLIPTNTQRL